MSRYRLLVGFLSSDPSAPKSIITHDTDADLILAKAKAIDNDFQMLSTKILTFTESLAVAYNLDLFERLIDSEELKRKLEHHRKPVRTEPLPAPAKKKTEDTEEAKIIKIGRSSMATRLKSRIW